MNTAFLIDQLTEVFPGKELTAPQHVVYRAKLARFTDRERQKLYDAVVENCKYFPKIADVYEQARNLGLFAEQDQYTPHVWTPTDCGRCGGSGLMAAFWSQEFTIAEDRKSQTLKLVHLTPYHESNARYMSGGDEVRFVCRCSCPAGDAKTLDRGIPRWSNDRPLVIERPWG